MALDVWNAVSGFSTLKRIHEKHWIIVLFVMKFSVKNLVKCKVNGSQHKKWILAAAVLKGRNVLLFLMCLWHIRWEEVPQCPSGLLGVNAIDGCVTPSFGRVGAASVLNHWPQMASLMAVSVTDMRQRQQTAKGHWLSSAPSDCNQSC